MFQQGFSLSTTFFYIKHILTNKLLVFLLYLMKIFVMFKI